MLPEVAEEQCLLVRADFSDDAAWGALCVRVQGLLDEINAELVAVDDRRYDGLDPNGVVAEAPGADASHAFLADRMTFADTERPVFAVDLYEEPGRAVRVTPDGLLNVQAGLTAGNVLFTEIAERWSERQGIYHG